VDPGTYVVREIAGEVVSESVRNFERLCDQMQQYYTHYVPTHLSGIDFRPGTVSNCCSTFGDINTAVTVISSTQDNVFCALII